MARKSQEQSQQGASLNQLAAIKELMRGMSTVADSAQAVERGRVLAGGVAVGDTARDPFLEFQSELQTGLARASQSCRLRSVGSIGGTSMVPSTRIRVPGTVGFKGRIAASILSPWPLVGTRTSTTALLDGATTLGLTPPSIWPTFTEMPAAGSLRACSVWIT